MHRSRSTDGDLDLLKRIRAGDEKAYVELIERYHRRLTRFALSFVADPGLAEDAAQETWFAMLRGLDRFEGRSSLRTWLFQICANRARLLARQSRRAVPVDSADAESRIEDFHRSGAWAVPPQRWASAAEARIDAEDLIDRLRRALDELPAAQRRVVVLRDVEGLSGAEVSEVLALSATNQRVLLHRGRSRLRAILEREAGTR